MGLERAGNRWKRLVARVRANEVTFIDDEIAELEDRIRVLREKRTRVKWTDTSKQKTTLRRANP